MTKLDFNFILKGFDNKDMAGEEDTVNAGKLLASLLYRAQECTEPIKYHDWAIKLYNKEVIELDNSDIENIRGFIKNHKNLFVIAQAQLLKKIIEAKE